MEEGKCFIGLEIGSSKIAAIAGIQENKKIKLVSFSEKQISPAHEVLKNGVVENAETTSELISKVLDDIVADLDKSEYEFSLNSVNVNVSNSSITSHLKNARVVSSGGANRISQEDVNRLHSDINNAFKAAPGHAVIHSLPKDFYVNDEKTSGTLVGKFGNQLSGDFTFITSKSDHLNNLVECVNQVKAKGLGKGYLKVENILLNAIADSCSLLNNSSEEPESKRDGVAIVNIGADATAVSIYHQNSLRYQSTIPVAGNAINADLIKAFGITFDEAETLKKICGTMADVVYESSPVIVIEKKYGMAPIEIFLKNAMTVVEWRLREIAVMVNAELTKSGLKNRILNGVILTGGTSNFINIKDIFKQTAKELNVRSTEYNSAIDFSHLKHLKNPKYSTLLGLVVAPAYSFDRRLDNRILTPKPISNPGPVVKTAEPILEVEQSSEDKGGFFGFVGGIFKKNSNDLNDNYN